MLWDREWTRGVANAWDSYDMATEVALYVRNLRESEQPGASATARNLLLRQMDSLGLTVGGLAKNHWIIASDTTAPGDPAQPAPPHRVASGPTAKERLAGRGMGVVDGGA